MQTIDLRFNFTKRYLCPTPLMGPLNSTPLMPVENAVVFESEMLFESVFVFSADCKRIIRLESMQVTAGFNPTDGAGLTDAAEASQSEESAPPLEEVISPFTQCLRYIKTANIHLTSNQCWLATSPSPFIYFERRSDASVILPFPNILAAILLASEIS